MEMNREHETSAANPLVSVILPTYNREHFLGESIRSVLLQTYRNFELIVVDDGSTDGSHALVASLAPDARYFWQSNAGASAARNRGLTEARGELIAFIDSDDLWHVDKLARQVAFLCAHPSVGVVYTSKRVIDEHGAVIGGQSTQMHSGRVTESLFQHGFVRMSSVVMQRDVMDRVGCFDPTLVVAEDYQYFLRASLAVEFAAIHAPLVCHRRSPGQLTSAKGDNSLARYRMRLRFYRDQGGQEVIRPRIAQRTLARSARRAAVALLDEQRLDDAEAMVVASLGHRFTIRATMLGLRISGRRRVARLRNDGGRLANEDSV
jgi:glycosyltransferase involved in cell wall biosynthesis